MLGSLLEDNAHQTVKNKKDQYPVKRQRKPANTDSLLWSISFSIVFWPKDHNDKVKGSLSFRSENQLSEIHERARFHVQTRPFDNSTHNIKYVYLSSLLSATTVSVHPGTTHSLSTGGGGGGGGGGHWSGVTHWPSSHSWPSGQKHPSTFSSWQVTGASGLSQLAGQAGPDSWYSEPPVQMMGGGQASASIHWSSNRTSPSGQKHPSTSGSWHVDGASGFSQVAGQAVPSFWYTVPPVQSIGGGHVSGSTHWPSWRTSSSGQKHPSTSGSWHVDGASGFSQVAGQAVPSFWYTVPPVQSIGGGHSSAGTHCPSRNTMSSLQKQWSVSSPVQSPSGCSHVGGQFPLVSSWYADPSGHSIGGVQSSGRTHWSSSRTCPSGQKHPSTSAKGQTSAAVKSSQVGWQAGPLGRYSWPPVHTITEKERRWTLYKPELESNLC